MKYLFLLLLVGCYSSVGEFCTIYEPVYTSKEDTEKTIEQTTDNNVAYEKLCLKK